jgi:hypothetical protein
MHRFSTFALLSLLIISTLSACIDEKTEPQKKVERPVEYDQFGNKVIYTADGEKELIDEDCD